MLYAKTHEWISIENGVATIGISDHAQKELGEVVYVEAPEDGQHINANEQLMVVESVKAASDIYAPVTGTVLEFNQRLDSEPELVNQDSTGAAWLVKLQVADDIDTSHLLSEDQYLKMVAEQ